MLNQLQVPALLPHQVPALLLLQVHLSVESTPGTSTGSCWVSVSTGGYGHKTTVTICSDVGSTPGSSSAATPGTSSVESTPGSSSATTPVSSSATTPGSVRYHSRHI